MAWFVGDRGARWLSKSGKQQLPGSGEFLQYQRIRGDPSWEKKGGRTLKRDIFSVMGKRGNGNIGAFFSIEKKTETYCGSACCFPGRDKW